MPKRKASQSIEEWLLEGEAALEASRVGRITECQVKAIQLEPTADRVSAGVRAPATCDKPSVTIVTNDDVAVAEGVAIPANVKPTAHVAIDEDVAATWFWDILAQSGYERW